MKTIIWIAVAGVVAFVVYSVVKKTTAAAVGGQRPATAAVKVQPAPAAQLQAPTPQAPPVSTSQQAAQWVGAAGGALDIARQAAGWFGSSDDDGSGAYEGDDGSYAADWA